MAKNMNRTDVGSTRQSLRDLVDAVTACLQNDDLRIAAED